MDRSYKRIAMIIAGLGAFMGTLDSSIVNVSLPTISVALGSSVNLVGWVILSYSITIVSLLLVFGALAEKKGFGFTYKYGFSIFITGSLLCGISGNIYFLILSRIIQGVGASFLMAVGPALITRSFPDNERGRGLSIIAMVVSVGLMIGPPLGGFIIGWIGWRWIFYINVPVSMVGLYYSLKYLKDYPPLNPGRKVSIPGAAVLAVALITTMLDLLLFGRQLISLQIFLALMLVAALFFGLFLYFESKPSTRLIGIDIFKNRTFSFSASAMLLLFISISSVTVLMPFFLERIKMLEPESVGLYLMTVSICTFLIAPAAGYLADKFQARYVSTIGLAILIAGVYSIGHIDADTSLWNITFRLVIIGVGMGVFMTPNTSSMMGSVGIRNLGIASGVIATTRTVGIAFGVGLAIAAFGYFQTTYLDNGSDTITAFVGSYQKVYRYIVFLLIPGLIFSLARGKGGPKNERPA